MTTAIASRTLIENLLDRKLYPHPCGPIKVVETHISWVILTGAFAYKIKKPVNLGFVDFRSLQRRQYFCNREITLNRRLTPNVYKRVVPITGSDDNPRFHGEGEVIEYAIKMRQFDESLLLDRLAQTITGSQIDQLADVVADFHKRIEVASLTQPFGRSDVIHDAAEENFSEISLQLQQECVAIERLRAWTEYQFGELEDVFEKRRHGGMVRECHGDMHLGNMFMEDGKPVVFDCIEFNDSFRFIDIMSEVAFTVMDLASHGRTDLAYRFLNRWLEQTGDYAGLRVLRFYLVYRAMVRAKVACIRAHEAGIDPDEAARQEREFDNYIKLATQFAKPHSPKLVITHGFSGSGKTSGTQCLVEKGAVRVRSDVERKRLFNLGPGESSSGAIYTAADTKRTYDQLAMMAREIIEAGFTAIVDATFLKKAQREEFRELAFCLGVPFTILNFEVSEDILRQRIRKRAAQGNDASEADESVLDLQLTTAEPLDTEDQSLQSGC